MFYNIAHIVVGILWRLWFRLEFYGLENVPKEGGFIFCCNHISGLDPTIVCLGVPRKYKLRFMGKAELFEVPFLKHIIRWLGVFPVSRGTGDTTAISTAADIIAKGGVLGIFPEGTRSPDGSLLRFKSGLSLIASQTKADIFPCAIIYTQGKKFRSRVIVNYGPVIPYQSLGFSTGAPRELKEATRIVQAAVEHLKAQHQPALPAPKEE